MKDFGMRIIIYFRDSIDSSTCKKIYWKKEEKFPFYFFSHCCYEKVKLLPCDIHQTEMKKIHLSRVLVFLYTSVRHP